jgi:hypothetical protein
MRYWLLLPLLAGCQPGASGDGALEDRILSALTFHASFDEQVNADYAMGDPKFYTAPSSRQIEDAEATLPPEGEAELVPGAGRYGGALRINTRNTPLLFFRGEHNMHYSPQDWNGTISFWLSLDPDTDLHPGYSDPVLISDKSWDNASLFVDFTRDDTPRHFRFAAFPDVEVWNPERLNWDDVPFEERPMVELSEQYFERDRWTHVVMTFENFNTSAPDGHLRCYIDGVLVGEIAGRQKSYTWDPADVRIALGIHYAGLIDEIALFNRALTDQEVAFLYRLDSGVSGLHARTH